MQKCKSAALSRTYYLQFQEVSTIRNTSTEVTNTGISLICVVRLITIPMSMGLGDATYQLKSSYHIQESIANSAYSRIAF